MPSPTSAFHFGVECPLVSPGLPRSIAVAHRCPSGPCFDVVWLAISSPFLSRALD